MLELKTKKELATYALKLAHGQELVRYRSVTYIPADYETLSVDVVPDRERTIWLPLNRTRVQKMGAAGFDILFGSDGELSAFEFMVAQSAAQQDEVITSLLVRTDQGLRELNYTGHQVDVTGEFRANTLVPMLNEDQADKDRVFTWLAEILDSEDEANSLLQHVATALAPSWSAVKYVLLLGDGRNGKSLFLKMLQKIFGRDNVSDVTRQMIAEGSPVVTELNGKLLNIVFDGQAEYLKDSGREKSLIAGESVPIRRLYESSATTVQTNALFLEGLQHEPKTKDKSTALQKRLVRYQFPNIYALDHRYERRMLADDSVGALLSLLIDRYVTDDQVALKLAPTHKAIELQLESMYVNSMAMQFLKWLEDNDSFGAEGLLGISTSDLAAKFHSWRLKENDLGTWSEPDVVTLFTPLLNTERRSVRVNTAVKKQRVITSFKDEAAQFITTLKETVHDGDQAVLAPMVED